MTLRLDISKNSFGESVRWRRRVNVNPLKAGVADLQQLKTNYLITPDTYFMSFFYSEVPLQDLVVH